MRRSTKKLRIDRMFSWSTCKMRPLAQQCGLQLLVHGLQTSSRLRFEPLRELAAEFDLILKCVLERQNSHFQSPLEHSCGAVSQLGPTCPAASSLPCFQRCRQAWWALCVFFCVLFSHTMGSARAPHARTCFALLHERQKRMRGPELTLRPCRPCHLCLISRKGL